jgi:predicted RNase H-like nuclease (RuvC/YqgF family)
VQRAGIHSAVDELKAAIKKRLEQIEARDKATKTPAPEKREDKTEAKIRSLEQSVGELSEKAAALDAAAAEVAREWYPRLNSRIDDLEKQIQTKDQQIVIDVTAQIKALQERLDQQDEAAPASTTDPTILERLNEIEEALTANAGPVELPLSPSVFATCRHSGKTTSNVRAVPAAGVHPSPQF